MYFFLTIQILICFLEVHVTVIMTQFFYLIKIKKI